MNTMLWKTKKNWNNNFKGKYQNKNIKFEKRNKGLTSKPHKNIEIPVNQTEETNRIQTISKKNIKREKNNIGEEFIPEEIIE